MKPVDRCHPRRSGTGAPPVPAASTSSPSRAGAHLAGLVGAGVEPGQRQLDVGEVGLRWRRAGGARSSSGRRRYRAGVEPIDEAIQIHLVLNVRGLRRDDAGFPSRPPLQALPRGETQHASSSTLVTAALAVMAGGCARCRAVARRVRPSRPVHPLPLPQVAAPAAARQPAAGCRRAGCRTRCLPRRPPATSSQVAQAAGQFNTLIAAVQAAGLVDTLEGAGPFTVFAPTDAAFAKIPKATFGRRAGRQGGPDPDPHLPRAAREGGRRARSPTAQTAATVEGSDVTFTISGGTVKVNDATVVTADVQATQRRDPRDRHRPAAAGPRATRDAVATGPGPVGPGVLHRPSGAGPPVASPPMPHPFPAADGSSPKTQQVHRRARDGHRSAKRYTATMETSLGTIVIALDPIAAPKTVNNFVFLAGYHYYDGVIFHRIIKGFVVPGRRPDRHRPWRPRLPLRRRAAAGRPLRDRLAGHGQRRPEHQRQPVLHHQRPRRRPAATAVLAVRQGREGPRRRRGRCRTCATGAGDKPVEDVVINSVTITEAD